MRCLALISALAVACSNGKDTADETDVSADGDADNDTDAAPDTDADTDADTDTDVCGELPMPGTVTNVAT
ncbi:MAG: hypothetical protein KC621_34155, partial [Myxococcales bacterium]|nr:hypothetical protein [Myxococcales bacterium]